MINRARGEVRVEINGKPISIVLNLNALSSIEVAFSKEDGNGDLFFPSFEDVFADVLNAETTSATKFKKMLEAVFSSNGHDSKIVGDLIPYEISGLALQLISAAFPDPDGKGQTGNP